MAKKSSVNRIRDQKPETTDSSDASTMLALLKSMKEQDKEEVKAYAQSLVQELKPELKQDLQNWISQNQTRVIEALAVFVALFTFISINIQVYNKVQDLRTAALFMGLMTIFTLTLVSFSLVALHSNKGDGKPVWLWWVFGATIIFLVAMLIVSNWIYMPLNVIR